MIGRLTPDTVESDTVETDAGKIVMEGDPLIVGMIIIEESNDIFYKQRDHF